MNEYVFAALLGALGGVVRALIGLLKALTAKRQILWSYWLVTVLSAGIIGSFTGIIFNFDPRLSALAGYAGTDILEGVYKSFRVQKVYMLPKR